MQQSNNYIKYSPVEGTVNGISLANKRLTYDIRLQPRDVLLTNKSFFVATDTCKKGTNDTVKLTDDKSVVTGAIGDIKTSYVRSDNHIIAMFDSVNIYLNGTLVERHKNPIFLDQMKRKVLYKINNVTKDFLNVGNEFYKKYNDKVTAPRTDHIIQFLFSHLLYENKTIQGGVNLGIELVFSNEYLKRVLEMRDKVIDGANTPEVIDETSYQLHTLDFYAKIERNVQIPLTDVVDLYDGYMWNHEFRNIPDGNPTNSFQFNLKKGVKSIVFYVTRRDVLTEGYVRKDDTEGITYNYNLATTTIDTVKKGGFTITSYNVRYGQHLLPFYSRTEKVITSGDTNIGALSEFEKLVLHDRINDDAGYTKNGYYYLEFPDDVNDDVNENIEFNFTLNKNSVNLALVYLYSYKNLTQLSYDAAGYVVQVLPQF